MGHTPGIHPSSPPDRAFGAPTSEGAVERYPLTPLQQGMLLHHVAAASSGVDVEQVVCHLTEHVDVRRFESAWQRTLEAHDVLRNILVTGSDGETWQQPAPDAAVQIEVEDWGGSGPLGVEERLSVCLRDDRARAFDLAAAPLMRWRIGRHQAGDVLIWTFHHILLDGRLFPLVLDDVFARYDSDSSLEPSAAASRRPFRDFCTWLQERDWSASERFWRTRLGGFTAPTALALPALDTAADNDGHEEIRLDLGESETAALVALAETVGVSLNVVVQGAWALLLHHYSRETDVVFGATRACRRGSIRGTEAMVGLLINTVPVRVPVNRATPLQGWLTGIKDDWRSVREHEFTPLALIQQWSDVPRGQPLFNTLVVFEHQTLDGMMRERGGPWATRRVEYHGQTNFDVTLTAYGGRVLHLRLGFYRNRVAWWSLVVCSAICVRCWCPCPRAGCADRRHPISIGGRTRREPGLVE